MLGHSSLEMSSLREEESVEDLGDGGDLGDAMPMLLHTLHEANADRNVASVAEPSMRHA